MRRISFVLFLSSFPIFSHAQIRSVPRIRTGPQPLSTPSVSVPGGVSTPRFTLTAPSLGNLGESGETPLKRRPRALVSEIPFLAPTEAAEIPMQARAQFTGRSAPGSSFWSTLFDRAPAIPDAGPELGEVRMDGGKLFIQGRQAPSLGYGSFKETFEIPHSPDYVLKLFNSKLLRPADNLPEKRREVADTCRLERAQATPRLARSGALTLDGRTMGYLIVEKVGGRNLAVMTPAKLEAVRRLFADLARAGVELGDTLNLARLRQNIMVGETLSGGFKAYVVDADLAPSTKSRAELARFYRDLLESLGGER